MKKLQFLTSLVKRTPKFSGCGFNAIPKNIEELEISRGCIDKSFHKVNQLRKEENHQEKMLKYYKNKFGD